MGKLSLPKPVRQVQKDSRKISGFSHSQQKTQNIKMGWRCHQARQHCHNSPTDQYPRNPDASANPVQQKIAWYLEKKIAPKEYARKQPELLACDSQRFVHC